MTEKSQASEITNSRSLSKRWIIVFYVLAGIYVVGVIYSIFIQQRLNNNNGLSFQKYQSWQVRSNRRYADFEQEASQIDASASGVANGADVDAEWKKARAARAAFDAQVLEDEKDLKTNVGGPEAQTLLADLKLVKAGMEGLTQETDALFSYFKGNQPERARVLTPAIDQGYHNLLKALLHLRQRVADLQTGHVNYQIKTAGTLKWTQYAIAGLLLIMVTILAAYGRKLTKRVRDNARERETLLAQVHQAEDKYRSIVDNAVEGVFQSTPQGHYITANMAMAKMYGYESPQELMSSITDINNQLYVNPHARDEILGCLQQGVAVTGMEIEVFRKDGRTIWVSLNVHAVYTADGAIVYFEGTVEDITVRRWAEYRRNLHYLTAGVLNDAATVAEARPKILQTICEILEWDMGTVWDVDAQRQPLSCREIWHRANIDIEEFETETSTLTFARGVGLAGKVWESGEPAWMPELTTPGGTANAAIAAKNGMQSAFCIPIKARNEVLHVLEFFSPKASEPDPELLQTLAAIGNQLGQMIERKRGEEALRESEVRKGAILESALDCIITFDHEGRITEFNPAAERAFGYLRNSALNKEMVELIIPQSLRGKPPPRAGIVQRDQQRADLGASHRIDGHEGGQHGVSGGNGDQPHQCEWQADVHRIHPRHHGAQARGACHLRARIGRRVFQRRHHRQDAGRQHYQLERGRGAHLRLHGG